MVVVVVGALGVAPAVRVVRVVGSRASARVRVLVPPPPLLVSVRGPRPPLPRPSPLVSPSGAVCCCCWEMGHPHNLTVDTVRH